MEFYFHFLRFLSIFKLFILNLIILNNCQPVHGVSKIRKRFFRKDTVVSVISEKIQTFNPLGLII